MKEEMFRLIAKKIKRYAAVTCAAALVVGSFRSDLLVGMGKELLDNFDAGTSFYVGKDSVSGADPAGVDAKRTLIMEAALEKEDGNYVYGESQYLTLKVSEVVDQDTGLDVTQGDVTGNVVDDENVEVEVILNKKENDTWKTLETNEYAVNIQEEYKLPVGENTYNEPGEYQIHINPKNDKTVEANLDFTVAEKELLYTVRAKNKNFDNTTNVELEVVAPEETYGVSVSLTDSAKQKAHFKNAGDVTETKSVEVIAEEGLSVDDYIVEGNEENRYDVILDWEAELKADIIANAVIKEDTLADIVEYSTKYQDENGKYWLSEMDQYNQLIIRVKDGMTGYKLAQNLPEEGQALQNDEISVETVELENGNAVFYVANEKGEISQAEISGLGIDTTAPAISMKDINGEANSFVVSNTEQTYKVEASDEESRIASVKYIVTDVEKDSIDWNGKEVKEASVENAVVSVPAFGYLYVQAIDNVGNAAVNDANSGSHSMVLDEDAPKLVIRVDDRDTDSEAVSVEKKHKLQIVAEDDLSGVASISYTLNDTSYYGEQKNEKYESLEDYKAEWKNVTLEGITLGENEELDGAYTLLVKSEDFAGNEIPKEVELYFDNTAPQYEIKVAGDNFHEKEVYYGNTGFEVELTVTEANEMAADATRLIIKRNGEILNAEQLQVEGISAEGSADQKSWKVTIPETAADGNYTVELSGMDAAGNSIEKIPTESLPKMILDKNAPSYTVEVKNVEPVDGFYYYGNEGFTAILSITETNKLAESLEVIVKRDGTKLDNTALTNENITIVDESEGERKNWKVSIPGTVAEGIYTVELSGTDAAGNGITVIPEDTLPKMILDITAPSYKIDVKNAETVEAPYYYGNAGFDITLSVTENNKMAVNANVVVKKDEVALDSAKLASEQIVITDESEGERKNWKVSIPAAASEGSYTVELKGTDAANNAIVEIQGVSLPKMILDKTAPEVSYSLNDQKIDVGAAKTISFGNTDRIYKVEIVEANGVKEAYYAISYADNAAEINQWKSVDEDWNATVKIGNNGYLFVKATDKAGNTKICDVKQPLVLESNAPEVAITDENDAQIKNVHPITVEAIDMPETGFSGVQYIEYELYEKGNLTKKDAYSGSVVQANAPENLEKLYEGNQYRLLSSILAEYGKVSTDLNGEYLLKVKATDYSGNSSKEQEKTLWYDTTDPVYRIVDVKGNGITEEKDGIVRVYSKEEMTVRVEAEDPIVGETNTFAPKLLTLKIFRDQEQVAAFTYDGSAEVQTDQSGFTFKYEETDSKNNKGYWVVTIPNTSHEFDGEYTFAIEGTDSAGNEIKLAEDAVNYVAVMDTTAPRILGIAYTSSGEDVVFRTYEEDEKYYTNKNVLVEITVEEHNMPESSSGFVAQDKSGKDNAEIAYEWHKTELDGMSDTYGASYEVVQRGEYGEEQTVNVCIIDKAGNTAVLGVGVELRGQEDAEKGMHIAKFDAEEGKYEDTFVIDTVAPVITEISYNTQDAFKHADDGRDYVNADTEITFSIFEHNLTAQNQGSIQGIETEYTKDLSGINWAGDTDNKEVTYKVEQLGEYGDPQRVEVQITDKAGNVAILGSDAKLRKCEGKTVSEHTDFEEGVFTDEFTVDKVAPVITQLQYNTGNLFKHADDGQDYVNADTDILFEVFEHNMTISSVGTVSGDVADANADRSLADKAWTADTENGNYKTVTYDVVQRGAYGDPQRVELTIEDRAGNRAVLAGSEAAQQISGMENAQAVQLRRISGTDESAQSEHTSFENGIFKDLFTVDKVVPVITNLEYSTRNLFKHGDDNQDYVNADTDITFQVFEHNLTVNSKGSVSGEAADANADRNLADKAWAADTENGDYKTATYDVIQRGTYGDPQQVELTIEDRAGNRAVLAGSEVAKQVSGMERAKEVQLRRISGTDGSAQSEHTSFENGTFKDLFTIDKVVPVITSLEYSTSSQFKHADDDQDYVNADTGITFQVFEHNLTVSSKGSVSGEVADANADRNLVDEAWAADAENEDYKTATYDVVQRGTYGDPQQVELTIEDRAGNRAVLAGSKEALQVSGVESAQAVHLRRISGTDGSDKSEHTSFENGIFKDQFTVDKVVPVITDLKYSTSNLFKHADDAQDYVNADTDITFQVFEHNLTVSSKGSVSGEVSDADADRDLADKTWTADAENGNYKTAIYDVVQRGIYGDPQQVELIIEDRAGNRAVLAGSEAAQQVSGMESAQAVQLRRISGTDESDKSEHTSFENGTFKDLFTVDKVVPVITGLEYSTSNLFKHGDDARDYVNADTDITFQVFEHNLTVSSKGRISGEVADANADRNLADKAWTVDAENGDYKTAAYDVVQRGAYGDPQQVELTIEDRAGNRAVLAGSKEAQQVSGIENTQAVHLRRISGTDGSDKSEHTSFEDGIFKDLFIIDKVAPVLMAVNYDTADLFRTADDGREYVRQNTTLTYKVFEHNLTYTSSGRIFGTEINNDAEYNKTLMQAWYKADGDSEDLRTTGYVVEQRGQYGDPQVTTLTIEDRAGNTAILAGSETAKKIAGLENAQEMKLRSNVYTSLSANGMYRDEFTVDTVAPVVSVEYPELTPIQTVGEGTNAVDYFNQPVNILIKVKEHNLDQEHKLPVSIVSTDKDVLTYTVAAWEKKEDLNSVVYTMNGDSQYDFTIEGTDRAGNGIVLDQTGISDISVNSSGDGTPIKLSTAVDKTLPVTGDQNRPVVDIVGVYSPTPAGRDICSAGHQLYNSNVGYRIKVYDPLNNDYASGIEGISFRAQGASGVERVITVDKDGTIHQADGFTAVLSSGKVENLAKGLDNAYTFDLTLDARVFNSNDIVISVNAVDVSSNKMNTVYSETISIDITAPVISVAYDNNDVQNEKYFKADRTALITIVDRNWNPNCMTMSMTGGSLSGWTRSGGSGNGDDTTWTAAVTFTTEGTCTFAVGTTDMAGNGQAGATTYNGAAPNEFILDKTAPVVSYSFDNNAVQNEKYYMAARTLTISVTDENFAGTNDIVVYSDGQASGVTFTGADAVRSFDTDGIYSFSGTVTDQAGNISLPFEEGEFVIDLITPVVTFVGLEDQHAYGREDEFAPSIDFENMDTNFYEGGITFMLIKRTWNGNDITLTGGYAELQYVLGQSNTRSAGRTDLYQLTDTEEVIDGLYTLTVYAVDQAGNRNNGEDGDNVTFSINRYGSVYLLDDATQGVVEEKYIRQIPELVVYEYNLSNAKESWIDLITSGGERTRLTAGEEYTVEESGEQENVGWRMRTYRISPDAFKADGEYSVELYVEDEKNNASTNSNASTESRGCTLSFIKDTEDPYVTLSGPQNGEQYDAENMTLTIDYSDNVKMKEVILTINEEGKEEATIVKYAVPVLNENGEEVLPENADGELDPYAGQITYELKESTKIQHISVAATDAAGNDTSVDEEDGVNHVVEAISFMLTTSRFALWYNNKTMFYGTIGGGIGVIAVGMGIAYIIRRKKIGRKDEKGKKESAE